MPVVSSQMDLLEKPLLYTKLGMVSDRQSPRSFVLSIPAPAQLAQVDEHSMELYVMTPDGIPVTRCVHAAVLICVKTAAIMGAVVALGPLKEEDYMYQLPLVS